MKNALAIIGLSAILLSGCLAPASKINNVSVGMSQAQVLKVMGQPVSIIRGTNSVCLNYNLGEVLTYFDQPGTPYEIRLVDDKVTFYGRAGDAPPRGAPAVILTPAIR